MTSNGASKGAADEGGMARRTRRQEERDRRKVEGSYQGSCGNIFNYANAGVLLKVFNGRQSHYDGAGTRCETVVIKDR